MPKCNTFAMNLHLKEIAKTVAPGAHAVLLLDQAGWHTTDKLDVPANITLLPLPPKCPELNPAENVWQFIARQLAVKPRLQILRRRRRPLLRRVEHARRSAMAHHVHRSS
jgi:hypothetical protein